MYFNVKRRLPGQGCGVNAEKSWGVNNLTLAKLLLPVNLSDLLFRFQPVSGLELAGGWAGRLLIWLPMLDMAARLLRAATEGRV